MHTHCATKRNPFLLYQAHIRKQGTGMKQQEQIANHSYVVKRSSANNGLPYRQVQLSEQETEEFDEVWPPKTPRSALRYTTQAPPVIRSGNRRYVIQTSPPPQTQTKRTTK